MRKAQPIQNLSFKKHKIENENVKEMEENEPMVWRVGFLLFEHKSNKICPYLMT
jgi:hypothetical protein